jgi:Flp pilus assembly pilin Flp
LLVDAPTRRGDVNHVRFYGHACGDPGAPFETERDKKTDKPCEGTPMKNLIARFVRDEQGQDLVEYALLLGLITVAAVTAVTALSTAAQGRITAATAAL